MEKIDLEQALSVARGAAVEAGQELRAYYGHAEALGKGDKSSITGVVTELDRETELLLKSRLGAFSLDVGFRGEEFGVASQSKTESDTTWLVDPIDGTAHFIRGLPFCTTMVALIENGKVVLSVIHDFVHEDTYWAVRGQGAYCNETKISVSDRSLTESLVSFETHLEKPENTAKYLAVRQKAGIIATVNAGYEFAMVASGKLDGRIGLDPYGEDWDYAPGSLLVKEAGGIVVNIGSTEYDYRNHNFIASNGKVYQDLTTGPDAIFPQK